MLLQIQQKNYEAAFYVTQAEYRNNLSDLNLICGISDTNYVTLKNIVFELKPEISSGSEFLRSYTLDSLNLLAGQLIYENNIL